MNKYQRIISIIMLTVISLSNVASPVAYAAEIALPNMAIPGTDLSKTQFATRPKFSVDTGSVLAASTSILTVGTQSLDLGQDTADSAHPRIPVQMQKLTKKVFRSDEDVTLAVTNPDNEAFTTTVQDSSGQGVSVPITESNNGNTTTVDLAPSDSIKPGKYKIIVTDQNGTSNEQDFSWGVLALNTDKSLYHPGETADIAMAVLNDQGDMVCDASLELKVQNVNLKVDDTLSTQNGKITASPQCQKHDFSLEPDYEAHYHFGKAGTYQFQLTAITKNGTHTITDQIQVTDQIPFDVQRVSATRIYPPNTYPMTFNVKANRNFTGTVTETVPDSFTITPATESAQPVSSYGDMQTVYLNSNDPAALMSQAIAASSSGGLVMPFHGNYPITQGFGAQLTDPTLQAFYTQYGLAGHDGIDFGVPMGTPLYAVDDGTVIWSGPGDYGTMVTILHGWGQTYYGHMSNTSVTVGQHVEKGQLIGYSGMSGEATGPHLHFGMKPLNPDMKNGYYGKVDPMPYLPIGQGQSIAALGASTNPVANAVYNTTVLGASDSAATPTPPGSPSTTPEVSPTAIPSILPTTPPASSQSASPTVVPSPTTVPTQTPAQTATPPANTNITVLQKQILLDEQIANSALTEKVKIITWHVSLKKGQSTSLGYDFQAPRVSPQFYLLGPAHFYDTSGKEVFQEQRQWQIASDDVGLEWYNETTGSPFNGYSWQYRKKLTIDHTQVVPTTTASSSTVGVDVASGIDGSSYPLSTTITLGSQSNKMLIVQYMQTTFSNTCSFYIDSPGNTLTSLALTTSTYRNEIFYTTNPLWLGAGPHTLVETSVSGCALPDSFAYVDFYNVNQTTPTSSITYTAGNTNATTTDPVSPTTTNQLVFCALAGRNGGKLYASSDTPQYTYGGSNQISGSTLAGQSGTTTCTWTTAHGTNNNIIGFAINPASSSSSSDPLGFPVLVSDSSDASLLAHTSTGTDVLFTQADGKTKLDSQLDEYDNTTGSLTEWVNIPDLSTTTDTIIYMYYGNPSAPSQSTTSTWNGNYAAVWHLPGTGPPCSTTTLGLSDSTSNGFDMTTNHNTTPAATGEICGAANLTSASSQYLSRAYTAGLNNTNVTVSAWVNTGSATEEVFNSGIGSNGYQLYLDSSSHACVSNGSTANCSSTSVADSTWHFIAGTWDGTNETVYADWRPVATASAAITASVSDDQNQIGAKCTVAGGGTCSSFFNGKIDEVEVSNVATTSGWLQTEYNNQSAPGPGAGDFFSALGVEETKIYAYTMDKLLGHGEWFNSSGTKQPFVF